MTTSRSEDDLEPDVINNVLSCVTVAVSCTARNPLALFGHVHHFGAWAWAYASEDSILDPRRMEQSRAMRTGPGGEEYERRMREFLARLYQGIERSHFSLNLKNQMARMLQGEFPEIENGRLHAEGYEITRPNLTYTWAK